MDPIAFTVKIFDFELAVRWYGIFVATAFVAGLLFVRWRARKKQGDVAAFEQLVFWGLVGGIIGARILYVIQYWESFAGNTWEIIRIDHGGLVFYGGLIGAFLVALCVCYVKGIKRRFAADVFAPALALGHGIGRIGCFFNGCCFGKPYNGPLSIQYPEGSHAAYLQEQLGHIPQHTIECLPVFPIQLVASGANFVIFAILLLIEPRVKYKGQLFTLYVMLYAVVRFVVEFGRGDYLVHYGGLTSAQILCLLLLPIAAVAFVLLRKFKHNDLQG